MEKNNKKIYYRASHIEYKVGDIMSKKDGIYSKLYFKDPIGFYETYLELARRTYYPQEVSRFECIFACETKEAVINYLKIYHPKSAEQFNIYAITPIENNPKISIASFNFEKLKFRHNNRISTFDDALEDMKVYWNNKNIEPTELEVLIDSDCKVLEFLGKPKLTLTI